MRRLVIVTLALSVLLVGAISATPAAVACHENPLIAEAVCEANRWIDWVQWLLTDITSGTLA